MVASNFRTTNQSNQPASSDNRPNLSHPPCVLPFIWTLVTFLLVTQSRTLVRFAWPLANGHLHPVSGNLLTPPQSVIPAPHFHIWSSSGLIVFQIKSHETVPYIHLYRFNPHRTAPTSNFRHDLLLCLTYPSTALDRFYTSSCLPHVT